MDHRDITMLARDYCEDINRETKPVIMLHSILIKTLCLVFFCVSSSLLFDCLDGGISCNISLAWSTDMLPILLENPEFQDMRDPDRTIFMHDDEVSNLVILQGQIVDL